MTLSMDVTDKSSLVEAAREFGQHHTRLDALINNAGILIDMNQPLDSLEQETLSRTLEVNTIGAHLAALAFLPFSGMEILRVSLI